MATMYKRGKTIHIVPGRTREKAGKKIVRWAKRRRSARAQSAQIVKTNKRIDYVLAQQKADEQKYGLYHEEISDALTTRTVVRLNPAKTAGLSGSPAWENCFYENTNALEATQATFGPLKLQMQFTSNSERAPITCHVFLVGLQKQTATQTINRYGPDLATISSPECFIQGSIPITAGNADGGGNIFLNPKLFKIYKQKKFVLAGYTALSSSQRQNSTFPPSTYENINWTCPLGYRIGNGFDSWTALSSDQATPNEYRKFLIVFTSNLSADLEYPGMSLLMQTNATAKT